DCRRVVAVIWPMRSAPARRSFGRPKLSRGKGDPMKGSTAKRAVHVVVILLVAQAALAFLMIYPSYKPTPHGVPVGYVGQASTKAHLAQTGDAFSFRSYGSERAARDAIDQRKVYGAVIASAGRSQLLVASGASPVVAQLLREAFAAPQTTVPATDVAPLSADDPRGATMNALVLPLISISLIAA